MSFKKLMSLCLSLSVALVIGFSCKGKGDNTIKIGALFAVTGPASFLGAPEAKTAQMLVDEMNAKGGIMGKKIELIVKDTAGSPEKAVSFANQLIKEDKVLAIIGPSTSGETMQIKNLCETEKTILISAAAAEVIVNPVAKYVFKTPQKDNHAAMKIYQTMNDLGIKKIGVVTSNDGFGKAGKDQLEKLAASNKIEILISEVYDTKATDLTGVLTKLKGKNVQAVVNWSIVPAQAIIAKNMKQMNFNVPLFQSHGFGNIKYVKETGKAGEGILFPCGRLLIADKLDDKHPQKTLLVKYKNDYEGKFKEDVSTFGGHAYDAVIILAEAIKAAQSTDKEKVRTAIEGLKNVVGTGGIFNMSAEDHNGLDINAFEMLTVKDGKFIQYAGKKK